MKRNILLLILVLASIGVVFAIASNWYKLAEITGVVKPSTSLASVVVNLGELQSAQNFTVVITNTTLRCSSECNISKLILAIPSASSEWYRMVGGFKDLYLKVSVDEVTPTPPDIPVIINGSSAINPGGDSDYWRFEFQETPLTYYSYRGGGSWNPVKWNPLKPGNHVIYITITGETSLPAEQVEFKIVLYLEVVPSA